MGEFADAWAWLTNAAHWAGHDGIAVRLGEHLTYTALAITLAAFVAVPLGWYVGHTGRLRGLALGITSGMRAVPTLGVITIFGLLAGVGLRAPLAALVVLAIPSLLAGAYAGIDAIEPETRSAARAVGMTGWQVFTRVELPLGLPLLLGGVRAATLQVVSTATLAAYVGAGGLGRFLFLGLGAQDYPMLLGSSLLVVILAVVLEVALAGAQRIAIPSGVVSMADRSRR